MAYYMDFIQYLNCSTSTKDKIARIEAIIEALEDAELAAAANQAIDEYRLDDGQTIIKAINRDMGSIENTIEKLERRKTRLINKCAGYRYNLQDGKVRNC